MYVHDATEYAYKHGYEKGYEAGKRDGTRLKWISIDNRLPVKGDADEDGYIIAIIDGMKKVIINWEEACRFKEYITDWTHIPFYPNNNK